MKHILCSLAYSYEALKGEPQYMDGVDTLKTLQLTLHQDPQFTLQALNVR